ncbi:MULTISPECIES: leucyl aminopeptidase [Arthrobacter]|uniref:Probable cytosol aminopeptidase n=2 Tax=Arthrobacter TaxID=1663 RepID=A0ABU9KJ50_9MICC|nr:leucyl aminopeptidase [Arthrobacter sp. YJM1]MDP5226169.1 leucyl aminopeptidase [Arthrobacter sp. YJM1]
MAKSSEVTLEAISGELKKKPSDVVVIGVRQGADGPELAANPLSAKAAEALQASLTALGVTGAADQLHRLPGVDGLGADVIALAGLGKNDDGESLRRAAGSAVRQLAGTSTVTLSFPLADVAALAAVAEGAALGAYAFHEHRSSRDGLKTPVTTVRIHTELAGADGAKEALRRAAVVGRYVNSTRDLVNQPPNVLYPESFAAAAKDAAKPLPVKVTVWDEKRLEKEGFGGILGVGKGSSRPPRLVKVEYAPAKSRAHLALVGKGITFDTGGISLKPPANMDEMKSDMAGAATVLNTALAAAELGLPVTVTAWLCIAENMPSGTAQRPSDVMTVFGGKTVEVLNTDAEGRLVMADGLVAASQEQPDVIIDVATLTGAQLIALGDRTAGLMGHDGVTAALKASADAAGELMWPMPIPEELRPTLDSEVADLANIGARHGGMMTAAAFLREFVGSDATGETISWAHIDIAGPSFNNGSAYGYTPKKATGSALRTLLSYAETLAS